MSQIVRKQDLPPPGGYKPIPFQRVKAKTLFSGVTMMVGYAIFNTFTFYLYYLNLKGNRRDDVELLSGSMALYPLLLAEKDRAYLKQLRVNREAEAELMKDVEGWEVGTLFGEPIFKTLPKGTLWNPMSDEYYTYASDKTRKKFDTNWLWC